MDNYHILLADDHVMLRQAVKKIINNSGDFRVIGEAGCGLELMDILELTTPDMVILDISMPEINGFKAAGAVKNKYPGIEIMILSMHKSREYLNRALSFGASGYLLKDEADQEIIPAINTIKNGGVYISPGFSGDCTRQDVMPCFQEIAA